MRSTNCQAGRRWAGHARRSTLELEWELVPLRRITRATGGHHVALGRAAAADDGHEVVHGQRLGPDLGAAIVTDARRAPALPPWGSAQCARFDALAFDRRVVDFDEKPTAAHRLRLRERDRAAQVGFVELTERHPCAPWGLARSGKDDGSPDPF